MSGQVYIRPIGLVRHGPQSEHGNAIRLAGGMVYASRLAVILRRDGEVVERWLAAPDTMGEVLGRTCPMNSVRRARRNGPISREHPPLQLGANATVPLDQPQVMGILNVTPDSFSDGGRFLDDAEAGRAHAAAMVEAGAAIIDVGGESTRPGAKPLWEGDEIARVVPAIEACAGMGAAVSVDTRKAAVMEAALDAGAHLVNDVSGLAHDPRSCRGGRARRMPGGADACARRREDLHTGGDYDNVVFDVFDALRARRDAALEAGIEARKIVLDPGIGFGKSLAENLALMNALPLFHALGHPLLLGASRKRMIGALSNEAPVDQRGWAAAWRWRWRVCARACSSTVSTMCSRRCRRATSGAVCAMRR